ncbi:hypothetical protein [Undibacterium sp. TC9W]|uniref:hypothetical protein n=1 Tax=Undibacterium sp. TC9W TaxID=3413053 RepID=UPI003BF3A6C2
MNEQELKIKQFELERDKFEFEKKKIESENQFLKKHLITILTLIISIATTVATLLVTNAQVTVAQIGKDRELGMQEQQKNREHSIELAKFIAANKSSINGSKEDRELFRSTLMAAYPDFSSRVFKNLEVAAVDNGVKKTWSDGLKFLESKDFDKLEIHFAS